jgi:hypothetical protein
VKGKRIASASRQTQIGAIGTRDLVVQSQERLDFRVDFAIANGRKDHNS